MLNPLVAGLKNRLTDAGDDIALISDDQTLSPQDVWRRSNAIAITLRSRGVDFGQMIGLTLPLNAHHCQIAFGILLAGAVPVFIDPLLSRAAQMDCLTEVGASLWIYDGRDTTHPCLPADGLFEESTALLAAAPIDQYDMWEIDVCFVNFLHRNGSAPIAAYWNCGDVAAYLQIQCEYYQPIGIHVEYATAPDLTILAIGMGRQCVMPSFHISDLRPVALESSLAIMVRHHCEYAFAPPGYWKALRQYCTGRDIVLPKLKVAATFGAVVNCRRLEELANLLPETQICLPYATAEGYMPIAAINLQQLVALTQSGTSQGRGIPIGRALGDIHIKVIALRFDTGTAVVKPDFLRIGAVGEFVVSGTRVAHESRQQQHEGEDWHRTGDVGYIDDTGMIWLLSRKRHIQVVAGEYVFPEQQEQFYNLCLGIEECAVVPLSQEHMVALIVPIEFQGTFSEADAKQAAAFHGFLPPVLLFHKGKLPKESRTSERLDRDALRAWIAEMPDPARAEPPELMSAGVQRAQHRQPAEEEWHTRDH